MKRADVNLKEAIHYSPVGPDYYYYDCYDDDDYYYGYYHFITIQSGVCVFVNKFEFETMVQLRKEWKAKAENKQASQRRNSSEQCSERDGHRTHARRVTQASGFVNCVEQRPPPLRQPLNNNDHHHHHRNNHANILHGLHHRIRGSGGHWPWGLRPTMAALH